MGHYHFVILVILLLVSSVQFSLGQLEEENAKTELNASVKTQKGRAKKAKDTLKESEESSKRKSNRDRSRADWRGAVDRFRNASSEEQRKMRGEFVRRMRSRGRNMERRTNSRWYQKDSGQDEHNADFQHRERKMEMERREHEHHFQLERMQKEHEMEMERLDRNHKREMQKHGLTHIGFELELPYDEMPGEQKETIQLIWLQLEQKKIQKEAEVRVNTIKVKTALRQKFLSQKPTNLESIEALIKNITTLQSEIKILEIKAMFEAKNLLTAKQMEDLVNQSKEIH